jgi:hypothetical protein
MLLLKLREKNAGESGRAVMATKVAFERTLKFLASELNIYGSDFVPYEGQLLTLFNVFHENPQIDAVTKTIF